MRHSLKHNILLLIFVFTSFTAKSEYLFIRDQLKVNELSELRKIAYLVMDAEGDNCEQINDRALRSSCQCKYRKKPLIRFRLEYKSVINNNPKYIDQTVAYSNGNKTITMSFSGYKHISKWCT